MFLQLLVKYPWSVRLPGRPPLFHEELNQVRYKTPLASKNNPFWAQYLIESRRYITSGSRQRSGELNSRRPPPLLYTLKPCPSRLIIHSLRGANVGGHVAREKKREAHRSPAIANLSHPPPRLCLRLPLTVSLASQPLPTPFHFLPSSLSDFSVHLVLDLLFLLFLILFYFSFSFCSRRRFRLFCDDGQAEAGRIYGKFLFRRWTQRLKVLHLLREIWQSAWKKKCWIGIEYWISLSNTQWPWQFLSCLLYCLDISGLKIKSSPSLAVNSDRDVLSNEWGLHHFPIRYFILSVYYNIWLHILVTRYRCELASKTKHVGSWRFEFWL